MNMRIPVLLTALAASVFPAFSLPMAPSLEAAKPIARAENRTILLDLTGKDWCPGCIYLKSKILDSRVMDETMGGKYIVVEIDYPRDPKKIEAIPEAERAARADILKAYKVTGLPCIIYMDAEGLPFAVYTEYTQTPEEYMEKIMAKAEAVRVARDAAFARAASLQGMEKARALVAALEVLPETCRPQYTAVLREISALDPQNSLGYSRIVADAELRVRQLKEWETHLRSFMSSLPGAPSDPKNLPTVINMCEDYLQKPGLLPELRQQIILVIADGYAFQRNVPMVYASMHRVLSEDPNADSKDAARARATIKHYDDFLLDELNMKEAAHQAAQHYTRQAEPASTAP